MFKFEKCSKQIYSCCYYVTVECVCFLQGMHGVASHLLCLGELQCVCYRGVGHCTEGLHRCRAHGGSSPRFLQTSCEAHRSLIIGAAMRIRANLFVCGM